MSSETTTASPSSTAAAGTQLPKALSLPKALTRLAKAELLASIQKSQTRDGIPDFRAGDSVRVHAKIVEGTKERVQIFEGVVIERQGTKGASATFTVRKISYNIGVERKFFVHSPRIEKIEVVTRGDVRRAKLYYIRGMKGKAGRIKSRYDADAAAAQNAPAKSAAKAPTESSKEEQASA